MAITLNCSGCGRGATVPDAAAGKLARCPKCGATTRVPAEGPRPAGPRLPARDGFGVASLAIGVLSVGLFWVPVFGCVAFPLAVVGAILGAIGLTKEVRARRWVPGLGLVLCMAGITMPIVYASLLSSALIREMRKPPAPRVSRTSSATRPGP